jgi:hypothetical protein
VPRVAAEQARAVAAAVPTIHKLFTKDAVIAENASPIFA